MFDDNPYPGTINGSLWMLCYEAGCYAVVAVAGILGVTARSRRFLAFVAGYACLYVFYYVLPPHSPRIADIHQLTFPFVLGMALFRFRDRIAYRAEFCAALFALSFVMHGHPGFRELFIMSCGYALFCIGLARSRLLSRYNRLGDYSYGTYIYAFPVGQIVAALAPDRTPLVLIAWGLPATLGLAVLSWHLVEKPAIARRSVVAKFVKRRLAESMVARPRRAAGARPADRRPPGDASAPAPAIGREPRR